MPIQLLGICGRKGSGKDTVADFIARRYGFKKRALAQPIKEICGRLFDFSEAQLNGALKEEVAPRWGVSPRRLLQVVGTELFQHKLGEAFPQVAQDLWVRQLLKGYQEEPIVVSDVRFNHEAAALRHLVPGTYILRIERPELDKSDLHASEASVEQVVPDHVIVNDGDRKSLCNKVERHFDGLLKRKKLANSPGIAR